LRAVKKLQKIWMTSGVGTESNVSTVARRLRAKMLDTGVPLSDMDALIAATDLAHDMTLVTHNTVDFQPVAGLRLVDWLDQ
jgi:tRNA(fMet)-specific endonuclease VapC